MGLTLQVGRKDSARATVIYGSYTWFSMFRHALARAAGIALKEMAGFGGKKPWRDVRDPLVPFLDHGDSEGELSPAKCAKVAPRIEALIDSLPEDYANDARDIAKGMRRCARAKKPLVFR